MVHEHSHSTTCMCVQGLSWWCCHAAVCWWFTAELKQLLIFSCLKTVGLCNLPALWAVTPLLRDPRDLHKLLKKSPFPLSARCLEVKGPLCFSSHYPHAPQQFLQTWCKCTSGFWSVNSHKVPDKEWCGEDRHFYQKSNYSNYIWFLWLLHLCALLCKAISFTFPLTENRHVL